MRDRWGNLGWIYAPARGETKVPSWQGGSAYAFDTIDATMRAAAAMTGD